MTVRCGASLLLLLLLQVQHAPVFAHTQWGIPVYVRVKTSRVMSLNAATSSFIFEGVVQYVWRDDSLFDFAQDGDAYDVTATGNGARSNFSVTTSTGFVDVPQVVPTPLRVVEKSYNLVECVRVRARVRTGLARARRCGRFARALRAAP